MRIAKNDIPEKIKGGGAVARQRTGFGDSTGYGRMAGEYFSLNSGVDLTPLLEGLQGDLCQCPHWGYLIDGKLNVVYQDGSSETVQTGDLFYWPPGHTLQAREDTDFVLFSPEKEHGAVVDHVKRKAGA